MRCLMDEVCLNWILGTEVHMRKKWKDSSMATKNKSNVDSELRSHLPAQEDETSSRQTPSHEEIRQRAYEIYLERDGRPGTSFMIGSGPNAEL